MKHIESEAYDPLLSDVEFYKLMEVDNLVDLIEEDKWNITEEDLQNSASHQENAVLVTWLPVAATVMLVLLILLV